MSEISAEDVGALKQAVLTLTTEMTLLRTDMARVNSTLAQIQGGKRVLWAVWSFLGIGGSILGTYLTVRGH
jgi:hypothetical protein